MTTVLAKLPQRLVRLAPVLALAALLGWPAALAAGFTDKEARAIFDALDADHHGKVTRTDFNANKMNAFYFNRHPDESGQMKPLTFADTSLSREFFDKADQGHKGYLDPLDIIDAVRFEDIDTKRRGYFDYADLLAFLHKIGR